ncbi:MAG TPA: HAMP domain-containing sensor histidine kinase, partial [Candidatus Dormibacteraeota bacterium]|nr:HAMP domain-containing sensor histidine kinase [Candidatus Dormibacteraeota bacterium]
QLSDFQTSLLERLTGAIGVAIDNTLLYEGIQDATKRLKTANRHLKELDQAKDEFISMASHQLRTPLTTVKGYISMMLDGDVGKVGKDQKEFLEYAYGGAQRMVHLISDLLNISRMEAGRFMIERTAVDLQKMAQEETTQLQTHAKEKGLKLEFIPPAKPLPTLNVDEDKTRQVVMNFIDNALYYTKKGRITVTLERAGDQAVLKVQDTGIGVPKADQAKLFKKFFRAENAHKVRPDGTGLGLYLAKRVIADQGGTLIFESAEGKGSTFGFKLPLDQNKQ